MSVRGTGALWGVCWLAIACSGGETAPSPAATTKGVVPSYVAIAAALAADDPAPVPALATELAREAASVSTEPGVAKVIAGAKGLAGSDLAASRRAFKGVSDGMIEYLRAHAPTQAGHVLVHCPMAFEDKGALWVQAEGKIANPYFGAAMLRCGTKLAWDATLPTTAAL